MTMPRTLDDVPLEELREILAGRSDTLPRVEAIVRIANSRLEDRERLLQAVLADPSESPLYRARAAAGLALISTLPALQSLVQIASEAEPVVLSGAMQLLGRCGGAREHRILEDIARVASAGVADQARTAAALIAYRHRLDAPGLPDQSTDTLTVEDHKRLLFDIARPTASDAELCRRSLEAERLTWPVAPESAVFLRCRARRLIACVDPAFLTAAGIDSLRRRKALIAVVATRVEDGNRYSASYLVLADPSRGAKVLLRVCRLSGRLAFTGDATVADFVSFTLRAVKGPGAVAVAIGGRFGPDGVVIERAESGARVPETAAPRSLVERPVG